MLLELQFQTVVVAGCASGVGKTSAAETVTEILSELCQTGAAKITVTHGDRGCPHGGKGCNVCSSLGGDYQIIVKDSVILEPGTDTCRLKAAGGNPVVWAITRDIALESAWHEMMAFFANADCVVVESNSLTTLIKPSLTFMVVDASASRKIWKPSAERLIASADYVVFNERGSQIKRSRLLAEIELLRGSLNGVIRVGHPRELDQCPDLMYRLRSTCLSRLSIANEEN